MATYKKNGSRIIKLEERANVKKHIKAFYRLANEIKSVAEQLFPLEVIYNEDNINDYTRPFFGRDLDSTESLMMLGKIESLRNEQKDNIK